MKLWMFSMLFVVGAAKFSSAQGTTHHSFLFAEPQLRDAPREVRDWLSFGMRDWNLDGSMDELYVHGAGLVLVWGKPMGLVEEGQARSIFMDTGTPLAILSSPPHHESSAHSPWDFSGEYASNGLAQFWVEWGGPRRAIGFKIEGQEIKKVKEIFLGPESAAEVTVGGLVFGPDENGKLFLDEFGVLRVLTRNCPPLSDIKYLDLDDDGYRDLLIQTKDGRVGVAFGHKGELRGLHWLEHTSGVSNYVLTENLDGTLSLIGYDALNENLVSWSFGKGKWSVQSLEVPDELTHGLTRLHAFQLTDQMWLWLTEHFHDRSMVGALVEGSEVMKTFRMDDIEFVGAPHVLDCNGDGTLDLVYANAKSNQLIIHNGLEPAENADGLRLRSSHELLFWSPQSLSADLLWPFFKPYPVECLTSFVEDVSQGIEIEHLRCEEGQLFAHGASELIAAKPQDDWAEQKRTELEDSDGFMVSISHLRMHAVDQQEISRGEWSHVLLSKSKSGKSALYINGELVGEGWVREEVEALRILFLGCSNLGQKQRFFHGAIDEVTIWNRNLTSAEAAEVYRAKQVLKDSRPLFYFDFESDSSNPQEYGSHSLDFENGKGDLVDGVHGRAMLFDGQKTYASLFSDIPDGDLSLSIWIKPSIESPSNRQSFLGIYGDWNLDFDLHPAKEWDLWKHSKRLHMHAEKIAVPENGFPFRYGEEEYYLSRAGLVFIRAGLDWKAVQTNGADPLQESAGLRGYPWIHEGRLNAVFGECHMWFQFNPESMTWETNGRLNPLIKGFDHAIAGLGGTVFIRRDEKAAAWWKPNNEDVLYPISPSAFGRESVGILSDLRGFWWVNDAGELDRTRLEIDSEPIPLLKPDFPIWMFMASSGSLFLLLGLGHVIRERKRRNPGFHDQISNTASEPELGSPLEIHKDLLFRLSEDAGEGVDTTNLDVIFDIHHIETDETRRSRRSRLLKELNDWYETAQGRLLIRREIDPEDRRRRIYVVDKGLGELLAREFPSNGNHT